MGMLPQFTPSPPKGGLNFPTPLSTKYQPQTVAEFIGLDKPKAVLSAFLAKPYPSVWMFLGSPGTGKTTMALALAKQLKGEVIHIASSECDLETVENTCRRCHYYPMGGGFWVVLVDEADRMTPAAQIAWLSKLDATARPPNTIFIFTANSTRLLERRFLSRCLMVEFQVYRIGEDLLDYLKSVWLKERAETVFSNLAGLRNYEGLNPTPDFARLADLSDNNVRDALARLEVEMLAGGIPDEVAPERPEMPQDVSDVGRPTDSPPRRERKAGTARIRFVAPSERGKLGPGWEARGKTRNGRWVMVRAAQANCR